jgi:sugar phosphate isomerase/epimerase
LLPGEGAIDLTGLFSALPAELPVSVEVPNDKQALLLGPLEWARRARTCSEAVLAKVDASRSSP